MNKQQKSMLKTLVLILAVLAILLGAVSALKRSKAKSKAEAEAASSAENTVTDTSVKYTALTYSNGTATLSFALNEDGAWYWADDPEFPLNENDIIKIINTITGLKPQQTITGADALEDYGLDAPSMTLTAAPAQGDSLTLYLGNQVTGDSGSYYMYIDGDETTVYVVENTLANELSQGIYDMMQLPDLPVISEEKLTSVSVQGAAETFLTAGTQTVETQPAASSSSGASSGAGSAETTVTWSSGGTDVTGNETVQSLISAVRTLSIDKCVDYKPSAEAVSLCGFDAPAAAVTVIYRDDTDAEQTLTLTVGAAASDGASRYVRINDDSTVYAMSADSLSAVLTVAAGGLSA